MIDRSPFDAVDYQTGPPRGITRLTHFLVRPAIFAPLLVCLCLAVSAWFVDHGLPVSDEGAVLTLAARISRGAVFYRHLDAYYFPGAAYLLAGWMWLFGEHLNVARWLAAIVFSAMALGLYLTAVQLLDRTRAALFGLALLSIKFIAWPAYTAYFYSDLSLCFASFAIALLIGRSCRGASIRLAMAGALVALATASKQSLGIYLAMASILLLALLPAVQSLPRGSPRQRLPELGAFAVGFSIPALPMLGYFASKGLLGQLVTSGLVRPFQGYLRTSGISFGDALAWWNLGAFRDTAGFPYFVGPYWSMLMNGWLPGESWYPAYWVAGEIFARALYTSIVVAFLVALWRWARAIPMREVPPAERKILAFSLLAFAVFSSAFPRADLFHVASVYPPILLLLLGFASSRNGGPADHESARSTPWLLACAVSLLLLVTASLAHVRHARQTYRMQLARADLHIDPANSWVESVVTCIEERLDPHQLLFVYGHEAYYYFLTGRYHPWRFVQLYPGQVGGHHGRPLVRLLRRQRPSLIVRGLMQWQGMPTIPTYARALDSFVSINYQSGARCFEDHPPPSGSEPPWWAIDILQPRPRQGH
jgi:4-amino-4-deoxy-L-arabinose transferase-like glycosyltransferase